MNELRSGSAHDIITSRANALAKSVRAVRDGRERESVFIEGVRLCEDAVAAHGLRLTNAIYTARLAATERGGELLRLIFARGGVRVVEATEDVFASLADTRSNQGVLLIARRPATGVDRLRVEDGRAPLIVVLHGVAHPANAGAILRAGEAAGATGVIATAGTCDLFNPKALRGAMGSSFRLPLWTDAAVAEVAAWCAERGTKIFALDARGEGTHTDVDWTRGAAIVVGAEGAGLARAPELRAARLRIPMRQPVESLNAAVALGVVLYEAARQRGFRF